MGTLVMLAIVACLHFYFWPVMNRLAPAFDSLPPGATNPQRESYLQYVVWARVFEILKLFAGLAIAIRLLFDRYEWTHNVSAAARDRINRSRSSERIEQI
jgi:hypothetical protein